MITKEQVIVKNVFKTESELDDNAMLKHKPELFYEWDFEKNDELGLDIYNISKGTNIKAWWTCPQGHSYEAGVKNRAKEGGCVYCSSRRLLVGFNDLATTNPFLSSLLLDTEDGKRYMQYSKFKVDWKCPNCSKEIPSKRISDTNKYGLSCPDCSDGIKYPEKVMREVLKQLEIEFVRDEPFIWSDSRRYDFYLPKYNTIIETHGGQHYNGGFKTYKTGSTLEQEIETDLQKKTLAEDNNIENYIVVDCRESRLDFIKKNIINSDLSSLFDISSIDWFLVECNAQKSVSYECLLLWNGGMRDIESIATVLFIHREMVRRYLKQWSKLEKCDFGFFSKAKRKIVRLDEKFNVIGEWNSISDAEYDLSGNRKLRNINKGLKNTDLLIYNSKWMYKSDYESFLKTGEMIKPTVRELTGNIRKVVQFSLSGEYISTYSSIALAAEKLSIKTHNHITSCCRGKRNSCGGFKWMYKEDYDKINSM